MPLATISRTITVVRGAYTHRIIPRPSATTGLIVGTACGIEVDPILTRRGNTDAVDCPYCLGRRSKWESKASR